MNYVRLTGVSNEYHPIIKCPRCDGSGRVVLNGLLATTLALVSFQSEGVTVNEAWRRNLTAWPSSNIKITAINNRLEELRRLGLVDRKKEGRAWRYFVIKPSNQRKKKHDQPTISNITPDTGSNGAGQPAAAS